MNNPVPNIVRFFLLLILQGIILKQVAFGWSGRIYFHFFVYPLFILLLPVSIPGYIQLFLAFLMGMGVDLFYDSPGVHASALVFTTYARSYILTSLEPSEGYGANFSPTIDRMGLPWFFQYASILLILHIFFYYSVEIFTFVFIGDIILKTIFSYISSIAFILMVMAILNPKS